MNKTINLEPGDKAPDFSAENQDGDIVTLKEVLDKKTILYFYPKDDTPGCTKQACDFNDNLKTLKSSDYQVIGISGDSKESHRKFREKYNLNFTLICDPNKEIASKYGVYREKNNYGKKTMGIARSTFVIDTDGKIEKAMYNVKATGHVERLLKQL